MDIDLVKDTVVKVIDELRTRTIPLGISNRHIHLSLDDFNTLFPNQELSPMKALLQPGHFAAEQSVTLVGPKGQLARVRILGPLRKESQVELSKTDARTLGINAPIRMSGDLLQTPGIVIRSEFGEITLSHGVIVALRHIHMSPLDALIFGVQHGQQVSVAIEGTNRRTIFDDVAIRVSPELVLEMHLDTDEANAAEADNLNSYARIIKE